MRDGRIPPTDGRVMQPDERLRPRWIFRGRDGAWDALMAAIATDPSLPAHWPIAPSGPSMSDGEIVLLWRSGRGGGIAALCTVVGEPEARARPDGPPEVIIGLRIERALGRPIGPVTLLQHPTLRPLAFMDLFETTEHRVKPAQEEALAALLAGHDHLDAAHDADHVNDETRTRIDVPTRLAPVVHQLLAALGADEAPPATPSVAPPSVARPSVAPPATRSWSGRTDAEDTAASATGAVVTSAAPTDSQVAQVEQLAQRHGDDDFTVDEAATTWRTGVGTARSRVERLIDSGLIQRAGTLRPVERPGERPTRGRPPVLYRLTAGSA